MRLALLAVAVSVSACAGESPPARSSPNDVVAWENGRWFDGARFVARTMYASGGIFAETPPGPIARKVDLRGGWVVPPFGDAHHHGIDAERGLDAKIGAFLSAGIFYVKNPNVIPDLLTPAVRAKINRRDSIDVAFSNGGLTSTGGHPAPLHDMLAKRGVFAGMTPADMEDHAYFFIDKDADLDAKWPRVLAGKPDFIKTFVLFANGQPTPPDYPPAFLKGLDPRMLPPIVARAHAAGLRVSAHVDTALDFRVAVDAGVDEINHMPFFLGLAFCREHATSCLVDAETAKLAASRGIVVVTTMAPHGAPPKPPTEEALAAERAQQHANFETLRAAGVPIAIGVDGISGEEPFLTAAYEAKFLHDGGFADNLALLKAWSETTARTIFPARRIGRLASGYEASFLVLDGDPIADFANVGRIRMKVKQGQEL